MRAEVVGAVMLGAAFAFVSVGVVALVVGVVGLTIAAIALIMAAKQADDLDKFANEQREKLADLAAKVADPQGR